MTERMVLRSLGELARIRKHFLDDQRVPERLALVPVITGSGPDAVEALARTARDALAELDALLAADRDRRDRAEREVARWRRLSEEATRAADLGRDLRAAAGEAERLASDALNESDRRRGRTVSATAARLANQAEAHATVLGREAAALAAREDVQQLLQAERREEEEMEVRETLALAGRHLDGGRHEEARRLLSSLEAIISSVPDLDRTFETLRNRVEAVKVQAAETALRDARRLHRREPVAALDLLEPLELDGLPAELARHLYGLWLTVCRRFGLIAAVHYRVSHGRGAVLMPARDGRWEVVSAIGLPRWQRGQRLAPQALRGARPLA